MIADITPEEKNVIEQIYGKQLSGSSVGYVANPIERVRELNDHEQRFFGSSAFISPHFFAHTLYKVKCTALPLVFNRTVRQLVDTVEDFRANYCNLGKRFVKVIFDRKINRMPEVVFRSLNENVLDLDEFFGKVMEADMRRDFDLRHDALIRFSVFQIDRDVLMVLVTMPVFLHPAFDAENFFKALSDLDDLRPVAEKIPRLVPPLLEESVRDYWTKILTDPPSGGKVPGMKKTVAANYRQKIHRVSVGADVLSDLRGIALSNRMMMSAIIQTAWGFLLQAAGNTNDVMFCRRFSDSRPGDPEVRMIPVRLTSNPNETVGDIIDAQFRRFMVSRSYSFFNWDSSPEIAGKAKSIFDHTLIFRYVDEDKADVGSFPPSVEGTEVAQNAWDAHGMRLRIVARYSQKDLLLDFFYDENSFEPGSGEMLSRYFLKTLQQIITDRHLKFKDFIVNLRNRLDLSKNNYAEILEKRRAEVLNFVSKHPLLKGDFSGSLQPLAQSSKLFERFEGDRISGDVLKDNVVFVIDGKVARSLDVGDGRYMALDIVKDGDIINDTPLLEKPKTTISGEVLTPTATLLAMPIRDLEAAMENSPSINRNIAVYCMERLEKYRLLWIRS